MEEKQKQEIAPLLPEELKRMIRIARAYYHHKKTQQEIAEAEGISRQLVTKILKETEERGIITFHIHHPAEEAFLSQLEATLLQRFPELEDVRVIPTLLTDKESPGTMVPSTDTTFSLAQKAAEYLDALLAREKHRTLIVSPGMVIRHLVNSLRPRRLHPELTIIPVMGFLNIAGPSYAAVVLAWDLARVYGGQALFLPGEAYIPNPKLKEQLEELPGVRQALEALRQADLILTGIGDPKKNLESRAQRLCFSEEKMRKLKELIRKLEDQLVGEIAGQPFDPHGRPIPEIEELFGSFLGLTLSELAERVKQGATSIGIVGGDLSRVPGIIAAIRAHYINVLITDDYTARDLIQY